jgi:hypothetical protein
MLLVIVKMMRGRTYEVLAGTGLDMGGGRVLYNHACFSSLSVEFMEC